MAVLPVRDLDTLEGSLRAWVYFFAAMTWPKNAVKQQHWRAKTLYLYHRQPESLLGHIRRSLGRLRECADASDVRQATERLLAEEGGVELVIDGQAHRGLTEQMASRSQRVRLIGLVVMALWQLRQERPDRASVNEAVHIAEQVVSASPSSDAPMWLKQVWVEFKYGSCLCAAYYEMVQYKLQSDAARETRSSEMPIDDCLTIRTLVDRTAMYQRFLRAVPLIRRAGSLMDDNWHTVPSSYEQNLPGDDDPFTEVTPEALDSLRRPESPLKGAGPRRDGSDA